MRKFKRESYILAQTEGQLDSSSVVGTGLHKRGANLFKKEECYISSSISKSIWGTLCSVLHCRDKMTLGLNIFMSSVMKISSLLGVKNLFVILVGCLVLSKLFTEVMENMQ